MIHSGKSWGLLLVLGSAGLLGCDRLPKPTALQETGVESGLTEFQVTYQCEDDVSFTARLSDEDAIADLPEQPGVVLPRVTSASGAKYSDGTTTLWDKGGEAFVEVEGAMLLADCQTTELVKTSASPTSEAAVPAADAANLDEEAVGGFPSPVPGGTNGYCDIYPTGSARVSISIPCNVSERQGVVYIDREDGVSYVLDPVKGQPDSYLDQTGQPAYQQSGLGENGQIYRLATETIYLYWNQPTAAIASRSPSAATPEPAAPEPVVSDSPTPQTAQSTVPDTSPTAISTAPCNVPPEITFEAEDYIVHICRQAGQLQYVGIEKGTANTLVTREVRAAGDGYVAVNGNYEYHISPAELVVYRIENGEFLELGRETVLSTTAN